MKKVSLSRTHENIVGSRMGALNPSPWSGKKIFVLGLGKSGKAAALLARNMGGKVTILDEKKESEFSTELLVELSERGIHTQFGSFDKEKISRAEQIVISPGISLNQSDQPVLHQIRDRGFPMMGELEFAFSCLGSLSDRFSEMPLVAITGTNGKSTTTAAIGHILKQAGKSIFIGGNIGNPLSNLTRELILKSSGDDPMNRVVEGIILEVSSYQLETIETFCPQISLILNITPDHESRYASFRDYGAAKARVFQNMHKGQILILNPDDPSTPMLEEKAREKGIQVEMIVPEKNCESLFPGEHNRINLGAARMVAMHLGISPEKIDRSFQNFKPLPHRLEYLGSCSDVSFYNDSKATNTDSAGVALTALKGPLVWIAGGYQDACSNDQKYRLLQEKAKGKARYVLVLGESQSVLERTLRGICPIRCCDSLGEAVALAYALADPGDQVLFSPGFKSFDRYQNFEQRGEHFRRLVSRITGKGVKSPTKEPRH